MICPFCNDKDSKVIDSRDAAEGTRRRRECFRCGLRYTTYESAQAVSVLVVKNDGRREEFDRDKLWSSMSMACAKRPIQLGAIDKITDDIEAQIFDIGKTEVRAKSIGELVMERLKRLDWVAYIRFTSVYRDFKDLESFKAEIDSLLDPVEDIKDGNQLSFLEDQSEEFNSRRNIRVKRKRTKHGLA